MDSAEVMGHFAETVESEFIMLEIRQIHSKKAPEVELLVRNHCPITMITNSWLVGQLWPTLTHLLFL